MREKKLNMYESKCKQRKYYFSLRKQSALYTILYGLPRVCETKNADVLYLYDLFLEGI